METSAHSITIPSPTAFWSKYTFESTMRLTLSHNQTRSQYHDIWMISVLFCPWYVFYALVVFIQGYDKYTSPCSSTCSRLQGQTKRYIAARIFPRKLSFWVAYYAYLFQANIIVLLINYKMKLMVTPQFVLVLQRYFERVTIGTWYLSDKRGLPTAFVLFWSLSFWNTKQIVSASFLSLELSFLDKNESMAIFAAICRLFRSSNIFCSSKNFHAGYLCVWIHLKHDSTEKFN